MDPDTALQVAFEQVYIPTFVKVAADNGIAITTQEDLQRALMTTAKLREIEASRSSSIVKSAHEALFGPEEKTEQAPQLQVTPEAVQALQTLAGASA